MRATSAAVALALALGASACGGSSGTSTTGTAATTQSAAAGGKKLVGTVGPGYTITLTQGGQPVTTLQPGTYTFVIDDKAAIHGFTLEQEQGGKFEQDLSSVPDEGTKTVTVTLTKGEWKFYCPPHESQMNGTFSVG